MATPVQELASMPSTATARTHSGANMDLTSTPKHRSVIALGFLIFLGLWYAFSPFLPQAVKQFLWAVLH